MTLTIERPVGTAAGHLREPEEPDATGGATQTHELVIDNRSGDLDKGWPVLIL